MKPRIFKTPGYSRYGNSLADDAFDRWLVFITDAMNSIGFEMGSFAGFGVVPPYLLINFDKLLVEPCIVFLLDENGQPNEEVLEISRKELKQWAIDNPHRIAAKKFDL